MDPHRLAEQRSLAYHAAIADRLDAPGLVDRARGMVERWRAEHSCSRYYADAWDALLSGPREALRAVLVADDDHARALRQNTPFAGALSPKERWAIWRGVRARVAAEEGASSWIARSSST